MQLTTPQFDDDELELLRACLNSGWVTQGPMTQQFERLIAERHGVKHAMATTSCTAALHLATMALELGPGDEVVVPAFTWVTSAHCAEYVGAKAVFADIDLATYNLDPAALAAAITSRTKAVVAVHLFGLAAPMDEINAVASRHGLCGHRGRRLCHRHALQWRARRGPRTDRVLFLPSAQGRDDGRGRCRDNQR